MTSRILNRFNIKTDRLLRFLATDKLSCDIHPRKMIKMIRRVSRDHIIIIHIGTFIESSNSRHNYYHLLVPICITYNYLHHFWIDILFVMIPR